MQSLKRLLFCRLAFGRRLSLLSGLVCPAYMGCENLHSSLLLRLPPLLYEYYLILIPYF